MKKIFTLIMTLLLICSSSWAGTFTIRVNKDAACTMDLSNGLYLWWWSDVDGNEFVSTTLQDGWYTATIISDANTISCLAVNRNSWGGHLQTADFDNITSDICFALTGSSPYVLQETSCESASGPISVTDGTLSDWDNLPQEYVYETICAEGASLDELKKVKVYADAVSLNFLVEWNSGLSPADGDIALDIFFNVDPGAETGGYGDGWTEPYDVDFLMEGALYVDGEATPFEPLVFAYGGAYNTNEWNWSEVYVDGDFCLSQRIGNNQMEIKFLREALPNAFNNDVFTVGFMLLQYWDAVGVLPNAPNDEWGNVVKTDKLTVRVAGTSSDEDEDTTIPTASDLAQYEQDGYFVACINFQGEVCNDIVFVGSYNGWSTTPEEMVHFTPLGGFDGWYVAVVPVVYDEYGAEANEGKPAQLRNNGDFSWDYQTGDASSWELISGSVNISQGYSGESNLRNWSSAEPVILKSLYFKNNNSPCGDIVTYDYTINLKAPDCGGYEPAIIGDFNNWVEGVAMAPMGDGWYQAIVNSMPGRCVNFRASTSADWSNAIQIYDSEYGAWLNIADHYLTEETTINLDYSAGKYTLCENDVPTPECYTLNVNVAEGGYVNISPEADCYEEGTQITLTAEAYEGYQFSQWSDGNTDNPRLLTMTEDIYLTAEFTYTPIEEHSYTIRVKKDDVSDMDIANGLYLYWWKTDEAGQVATMTLDGDGWYTTTITTTATSINCLAVNVNVDNEGWIGQQTTDYTNITGDICLAIGANDGFYNFNYNLYAVPCEDMEYTREHDFEDANTNAQWHFVQDGQTNYWTIGSAAGSADGGSNALYITSDGYNYAYNNTATSASWAYLPVTLSYTDSITFSWKGIGESGYDYLRVYLLPKGYTPLAGNTELPEVAISLSDMLIGTYEWQHFAAMAGVEGEYNLCLMWRNDLSWGETPIAIDNVFYGNPDEPSAQVKGDRIWPIILDDITASSNASKIVADFRVDDIYNFLYLWDVGAYVAGDVTGLNFHGNTEGYLALTVTAQNGWSGLGFYMGDESSAAAAEQLRQRIIANPDNYYLHFAMKATTQGNHQFYTFNTNATSFAVGAATIDAGQVIGDFPRDGEWYEFDVPMADFADALATSTFPMGGNIFCALSGATVGSQLNLDALYFYEIEGEEEEEETEYSYTIRVKKDNVSDMDISNGLYLYWWKTDEAGQVATMTLDSDGWYTTTITTTATSINCLAVNVNVDNEGWIGQQTTDYTNITGDICLAIGANDAFYHSNYNLYAVPCEDMEYTLKHDFEDANTNAQWHFVQDGQTNYWTIGSAAGSADGGSNALYITSDGYNYAYEVNDAISTSWAYLPVTLSYTDYITFSWKGMGESGYDYLRVYLLPKGYTPQAGNTELPEVAIDMSETLNGTSEWQHFAAMAGVEGEYNLCFMWQNDNSVGQTPIAIDNIAITYPVTNLVVITNCGKAYASWESEAPYYEVAVFNSGGERVLFGIVDVKEGVSNSQPFSDGEYIWQVTPMYSSSDGDYAGEAVQVPFTISADNCVDLGIYNLDYTINGETVNITWESEAPQYRIWMYDYNYNVLEEKWLDTPNYSITLSEMGKYHFGIRGYNADATQYSDYSELDIDFVNGEIPYNLNFVYAEQGDNGLWNNAYQRPIMLYSEDYQTIMRIYPMPAYENSIVGTYFVENNNANLYAGGLYGLGSYITYRGLTIAEYMQNGMVTIARENGNFVVSFDLTDANGNVYTNTCTIVNMYGDNVVDDYVTALSATKALELTQSLEHTNLTTMPYFVEGKISTMHNTPMQIVHYGTAIFDISEDGYENNQFKCYQAKWLNNTNFTTGEEIALGDSVVVYGNLQNYRGNTPEIQGYIYQHYPNELEETCYTLNVLTNNDNYGYVDVLPYQECYLEGEAVTLTAVPYAGYEFVEWSDGVTDAVRTINMYSDVQLTAIFRDINNPDVECYTLTLYPEQLSDGQGGYAFAAPNFDCYEPNTSVVIRAHAAPGYVFSHWSDGDTNAERTIIMTQNLEYTAYFAQELGCYQLNVTSTDGGHVDVTPATQGCYEEGTIVTLAAVADEGFEFVQWNDGNKDATRVVVMNSDCNFHATFTRTATKYDIQNLAVTSSNLKITAKWSSLATRFEITITNNKNEVVNSEKVDISEDNKVYRYTAPKYTTYTITVKPLDAADNQIGIEASKSITLERKYSLNIYTEYGGTVNEEVNGDYSAGTSVEIIATPNNGYRFSEWSDGDQNAKRTLIMDQDYDLMATFKRIPTYTLEVFEGENGLANIPAGSYTYQENEVVQLTPIPNDGYLFDHWVVNGVNDSNETITLTMTQNYSVYPVCVAIPIPTYTLTILPGEFGKANMAVGTYTYNEGEKVTLLPVADADYLFDQWVVNGEAMTDSVLVLDMVKDYEVMPTFVPNQVAVENIFDGITIRVEHRTIMIEATQTQDFVLYDLVGHMINQCPHTRVATFTVPSAGLYLVRTASGVKKIHVE